MPESGITDRQLDYPPSGRGKGHVTHFHILGFRFISLERMKLDISNLVCLLNVKSRPNAVTHVKFLQYGGAFRVT